MKWRWWNILRAGIDMPSAKRYMKNLIDHKQNGCRSKYFGALMFHLVGRHVDDTYIIAIQNCDLKFFRPSNY